MFQTSSSEVELEAKVKGLVKTPGTTAATTTYTSLEPNAPQYGLFGKLPSEVRILVWNGVLESDEHIVNAFKFMSPKQPLMVATCPPNKDIDAAILRTCRGIYEETLPILYGTNIFGFYSPSQIPTFAFGELYRLSGTSSLSGPLELSLQRYGRLSMLRAVSLHLCHPDYVENPDRKFDPHYIFTSEQEAIWSYWADFFQPSSKQQSLTFPMLEHLCLDFSHWRLGRGGDKNKLRIEPILRKLRPSGGLQSLQIIGIKHEQNLNDLKHGFLKHGGIFILWEIEKPLKAQETVSHTDLHSVSKGVRDILQKDGISFEHFH